MISLLHTFCFDRTVFSCTLNFHQSKYQWLNYCKNTILCVCLPFYAIWSEMLRILILRISTSYPPPHIPYPSPPCRPLSTFSPPPPHLPYPSQPSLLPLSLPGQTQIYPERLKYRSKFTKKNINI